MRRLQRRDAFCHTCMTEPMGMIETLNLFFQPLCWRNGKVGILQFSEVLRWKRVSARLSLPLREGPQILRWMSAMSFSNIGKQNMYI